MSYFSPALFRASRKIWLARFILSWSAWVAEVPRNGDCVCPEVYVLPLKPAALAPPDAGINEQAKQDAPFQRFICKSAKNALNLINGVFNLLDYESCLEQLKTEAKTDRTALSYAFRPLTKNGYVSKRKDGCVSILAKGRELFPGLEPLVSAGGGEAERKRVMAVSRLAMWMEEHGFPLLGELPNGPGIFFIPSACWRKITPGILSMTRFVGMLVGCQQRLAVYDIGDGHTLTIGEPLPSIKRLTEAVEEHWKAMIHAAIEEAARQGRLPYFEKAFVQIEIVTPRGSNMPDVA